MIERLKYVVNIVVVALLLGAIAISRDGTIVGESLTGERERVEAITTDHQRVLDDGSVVINSTALGKDIVGYAGRVPVEVYAKDGVITSVVPLDNNETPSFFRRLQGAGLFDRWNGMTLQDAATAQVDGVSGATYSAYAVIDNVRSAASYGSNSVGGGSSFKLDLKTVCGLLVVLFSVMLSVLRSKSKILKITQMVLNVGVVGFWCSSFLSLGQFVTWMSSGFNFTLSLVTVVLLGVVVVMPLLGRKGTYCSMHCPMGSAQELLWIIPLRKWKFSARVNKTLNQIRYYILYVLLLVMWCGVGFSLMDYEVFAAFLLSSAPIVVLVMCAIFLILSLFVRRPYCRMVCPTGALLTVVQSTRQ